MTIESRSDRRLALHELIRRIVECSDRDALVEFHDYRTIFSYLDKSRLLFAEYVDCLRQAVEWQADSSLALQAYDLTTDKFLRLPNPGEPGIDCRKYFQAALTIFSSHPATDEIQAELGLAEIFQRLVYRHFELSLKECQRNAEMTRYAWKRPGGSLLLLLPRSLSGAERRKWLSEHVPDVNPSRPGERDRVQMIIHQHFDDCRMPLEDALLTVLPASDYPDFFDTSLAVAGLAATVAEEKSARLLEQRPAIQKLGAANLKAMILRIFEDIADGDYQEGLIARQYGLSKAAFSRFAGGQWNSHVPDLFRNAARVLSGNKVLVGAIRDLGIRPRTAEILPEGFFP